MRCAVPLRCPPSPPSSSAAAAAAAFPNGPSVAQGNPQQPKQSPPSAGGREVDLALRMQDHVAKLSERLTHADGVIQQQATAFSMLQRQQAVLERRVVAVEEEAARVQQKIAETTRLASDVVLQHRNVEALVRQVEKLVLKHAAAPKGGRSAGGEAPPSTSGSRGDQRALPQATQVAPNSPAAAAASAVAGVEAQVAALSTRLEALQARIDQLTLEKLALDKVQSHAQKLTKNQQRQESLVEAAVARVTAAAGGGGGGGDAGSPGHPSKSLAALLKRTGAFPFKDATGATRISSQKVLVRGVPVNFGASDIRDLLSRAGAVVSCVVRRTPAAPAPTEAAAHAPRYRSQQQQRQEEEEAAAAAGEAETADPPATSAAAAKAQERVFEVTYQTVEQAVRAVLQLDAYRLHGKHVISVEPVVAADIIAAIQQLEQESRRR
ncbi:uncharacterized protein Tco025E_03427 [Trypanosoma conorhini]|uniref:RNA-binding protein n=1 Tax=Trypanosoma conorhini TaxID=83891 RepID=A0A422PV04_9TRYP|nr:uncharacterized protein Tco025E_03427 [Trypanosoma conorhini]RNF21347.1 hypothetical protein Tco025E_03427 [Trypanosoma conorhini]